MRALLLLPLLGGCLVTAEVRKARLDGDGDGAITAALGGGDCDDGDAARHPGAADTVGDEVDQDCDGVDGVDADGDGFASVDSGGEDCDDGASAYHPGAVEVPYDGVDQDCDPANDDDVDGDGYAAMRAGGADCDDTSAAVSPAAADDCATLTDRNCDERISGCGPLGEVGVEETLEPWVARLRGADAGEGVGAAVAAGGDLSGDGAPDVLLGAAGADRVYLVAGPPVFNNDRELDLADGSAAGIRALSRSGAGLGAGAAVTGDLDQDGYDDLVLASAAGAALVLGPVTASAELSGRADWLVGADGAGAGVAVGDFNGDDRADLVVGATGYEPDERDEDAGAVFLLSGPVSGGGDLPAVAQVFYGEEANQAVGAQLVTAGDIDGDGFDDLLVGAPAARRQSDEPDAGVVYLVFGSEAGLDLRGTGRQDISYCDVSLKGTGAGERVGSALAAPGDVNQDGYADILVGTEVDGVGHAYLVLDHCGSGSDGCRWSDGVALSLAEHAVALVGGADGDEAGVAVAGVGDIDGDGRPEVLVGAPGAAEGAGQVYILGDLPRTGTVRVDEAGLTLTGGRPGDALGASASAVGDVDGDGVDDVLVGAPGESTGAAGAGTVYLLSIGRID